MSEMSPSIVDQVGDPSHGNAMQNANKVPPADYDFTSDSDDDGQNVSTKNAEDIKVTKDVAEKGKCIRCGRGCVEVLSDSLQCSGCGSAFHLGCLREGIVDVMLLFKYA
jgi:hypothetical protein